MSPNRFEPTTTSNDLRPLHEVRGQDVDVELVDADVRVVARPSRETRSSQYGIVIEMPFDLVADVTCRCGRVAASSNANLQDAVDALAREHRFLEHDLALGALEHAGRRRDEYSPSVFSRTTTKSMSPGLRFGERRRGCRASAGTAAG